MLDYRTHAENKSLYNTPNTWGIYIINLVCKWLKDKGGLEAMERENEEKAKLLYDAIDASDFYRGHADHDARSIMNVTFRLPSEELEKKFACRSNSPGNGRPQGTSISRRNSRLNLQRVSTTRSRSAGYVYERV